MILQAVDSVTGLTVIWNSDDSYPGSGTPTSQVTLFPDTVSGDGSLYQAVASDTGQVYVYRGEYPGSGTPTDVLVLDIVSRELPIVLWQAVDSGTGQVYIWVGDTYPGPNTPLYQIQLAPTSAVRNSMWITNWDDGTVSRVDIASGALQGNITVGTAPAACAWDGADGIWVANSGSNNVSRISRSSGLVTDTVSVGTTPMQVAWDHADHMYVACVGSSDVHRVNITTKVVDSVVSCHCGSGLAWDGATHMHTVRAADTGFSRINISTGLVDGELTGAPQVQAITWDHNDYMWYCKQTPDATQRLGVVSYAYAGEMPSSPYARAMAWEDTGKIWATHASGLLVIESVADFSVETGLSVSVDVRGVAWDGGQYMYVCDTRAFDVSGHNRVLRVNRTTHAITSLDLAGTSGAGRVGAYGVCSDAVTI